MFYLPDIVQTFTVSLVAQSICLFSQYTPLYMTNAISFFRYRLNFYYLFSCSDSQSLLVFQNTPLCMTNVVSFRYCLNFYCLFKGVVNFLVFSEHFFIYGKGCIFQIFFKLLLSL